MSLNNWLPWKLTDQKTILTLRVVPNSDKFLEKAIQKFGVLPLLILST